MSNAAFLLIAIGLSVVGSLLIWLFNRKPRTFMSSIDDFSREMKALGRDPNAEQASRRRRRPTESADHEDPTQERRS